MSSVPATSNEQIKEKLCQLYDELFTHNGFADLQLEIKILKRGQKEVIIRCGKQYRFVVDYQKTDLVRASQC